MSWKPRHGGLEDWKPDNLNLWTVQDWFKVLVRKSNVWENHCFVLITIGTMDFETHPTKWILVSLKKVDLGTGCHNAVVLYPCSSWTNQTDFTSGHRYVFLHRKKGWFHVFFAFWSQPCLQTSRIAYPTVIKDMWKCLGLLLKFHEGNFTQPKLNRIYGSVPQLKSEVLWSIHHFCLKDFIISSEHRSSEGSIASW